MNKTAIVRARPSHQASKQGGDKNYIVSGTYFSFSYLGIAYRFRKYTTTQIKGMSVFRQNQLTVVLNVQVYPWYFQLAEFHCNKKESFFVFSRNTCFIFVLCLFWGYSLDGRYFRNQWNSHHNFCSQPVFFRYCRPWNKHWIIYCTHWIK